MCINYDMITNIKEKNKTYNIKNNMKIRNEEKMRKKQITLLLFIFLLSFVLPLFSTTSLADTSLNTYSPYCILMEASTGNIIYEKDAHAKVPPASTTKIMTAILTLEHCQLTDTATVSHNAIYSVPVGYTHAYLVEGEILTIEQLLHILLIPSANDAANVLAEHIAGSVESFATMMNTKALELGMEDTHFVNPNGVQNEKHYSTAYDLALLGRYAMQNETFRKIVSTTQYTLPATNNYPKADRYFKTTNELIAPDDRNSIDNYYYPYATGIKTGYTNAAKNCIVASSKKDDVEYIVVILGADKLENGLSARYLDCINLFNYAFENYKTYTMHEENSVLKQLKVAKASIATKNLDIVVKDKITLLLKKDTDASSITPNVEISSDLVAPISKNTVIGTITYQVDGNTYTSDLLAGADVLESNAFTNSLTIASIIIVLFLLYRLLNLNNKKKKRKRKKSSKKASHAKSRKRAGNDKDNYLYW